MAHKRFGRAAGLSKEQVADLVRLDPGSFDTRTHAALTYVRDLLTRRQGVGAAQREAFESAFAPAEREYVLAAMKAMFCTNLLVNGWRLVLGKPPAEDLTCPL